jgi:hypothetical protein
MDLVFIEKASKCCFLCVTDYSLTGIKRIHFAICYLYTIITENIVLISNTTDFCKNITDY